MIWVRKVVLVLFSSVVALQGFLLYALLRAYGRALLRIEELSERLAWVEATMEELSPLHPASQSNSYAGPDGWPSDASDAMPRRSRAPSFSLSDLEGRERALQEFLGEQLVVVFFSPQCSFCQQLAPSLGKLSEDGRRVLLISHGEPEEHHLLVRKHGWKCDVLLQQDWEATIAWRAYGTPTGYLLDAQGRIASDLAVGADDVLGLMEAVPFTRTAG